MFLAPGLSKPRRWPLLLDAPALLLEGYNKAILLGKHNDVMSHHLLKSCCREQWELPAVLLLPCFFLLPGVRCVLGETQEAGMDGERAFSYGFLPFNQLGYELLNPPNW